MTDRLLVKDFRKIYVGPHQFESRVNVWLQWSPDEEGAFQHTYISFMVDSNS